MDVAAASEAGLVGYSKKNIHSWRKEFYENEEEFDESLKGKYSHPYVLDDEKCRKKALDWLHERNHQPSMTAATECHIC